MPKVRRAAKVRGAKSITIKVTGKLGGRKNKIGVKELSYAALLKEVEHTNRPRDKNKIISEIRQRGLSASIK